MMRILLLCLLLAVSAQTLNGQSEPRRSSGSDRGTDALSGIFIDEIGIRLISEGLILESEIDPETYVLGPLDALGITIKGPANVIYRGITVNPAGDITIPGVGVVRVSGLSLSDATDRIQGEVRPYYANSEILVTLDIPRTISVHLLGDVRQPGQRRVPSQSRLDAVIMSLPDISRRSETRIPGTDQDSPDEIVESHGVLREPIQPGAAEVASIRDSGLNYLRTFSLRNIHIQHSDGSYTVADLLGYYFGGIKERNPVLRSGDQIMLAFRRTDAPRVSISGAVHRSFNTEYRSDDTLADLLRMAGGLMDQAEPDNILIYTPGLPEPLTVSLAEAERVEIAPNSRIIVTFKEKYAMNTSTWVAGEVSRPGSYPIADRSTTLRELLVKAGGYSEHALPQAAFIEREIYSNDRAEFSTNPLYIGNLLTRTAPVFLDNLEYLELEKMTSLRIIHVDLRSDFVLDNTRLHDNDRLVVPRDQQTITVWGQVNRTGYYPFMPDYSVDEYLRLAGGPAISADTERIYVIKAGNNVWFRPNETRLESGDMIFVDRVPMESYEVLRRYELEMAQQRNNNLGIIFTGLATLSSIITTVILLSTR